MSSPNAAPPPLRLPRYTFLINGTVEERRLLSEAIGMRDPGMLVDSLRSPLTPATQMLFFESISPHAREQLANPPFRFVAGGIDNWFDLLTDALCTYAGPHALAELLLLRLYEAENFAARFLILDAADDEGVRFLASKLGPDVCMFISINSSEERSVGLGHYLAVDGTVEAQIAQLEHKLTRLPV